MLKTQHWHYLNSFLLRGKLRENKCIMLINYFSTDYYFFKHLILLKTILGTLGSKLTLTTTVRLVFHCKNGKCHWIFFPRISIVFIMYYEKNIYLKLFFHGWSYNSSVTWRGGGDAHYLQSGWSSLRTDGDNLFRYFLIDMVARIWASEGNENLLNSHFPSWGDITDKLRRLLCYKLLRWCMAHQSVQFYYMNCMKY